MSLLVFFSEKVVSVFAFEAIRSIVKFAQDGTGYRTKIIFTKEKLLIDRMSDILLRFFNIDEGADKILDYYRASKGAFLCIQKNKRILHYGYIIKQSL